MPIHLIHTMKIRLIDYAVFVTGVAFILYLINLLA